MARISRRIGSIAESATLAVDAKAKALKAAGRPVIGFGAGEPDFPTPDYIVEAAVAAARKELKAIGAVHALPFSATHRLGLEDATLHIENWISPQIVP